MGRQSNHYGINKLLDELDRLMPVRLKGRPRSDKLTERHLAIQAEKGISVGLIIDPKWYKHHRLIRLECCVSGTGEFVEILTNHYIRYGDGDHSWIMRRNPYDKKKDIQLLQIFNLNPNQAHNAVRYELMLHGLYDTEYIMGRYNQRLAKHAEALKKIKDREFAEAKAALAYKTQKTRIRYVIIQQLEAYNQWARPILQHRAAMERQRPLDVDLCEPDYRGINHVFSVEDLIPRSE